VDQIWVWYYWKIASSAIPRFSVYFSFANAGFTGMSGLLVGGAAGVLRSTTPTLFALASAIQWFVLGSTFWGRTKYCAVFCEEGNLTVGSCEGFYTSHVGK
jgi:hypothetical protein